MVAPSPAAAPPVLTTVAERVERRMAEVLDVDIARWSGVDPGLGTPLASLRAMALAGGKRLRPAFCHWAFVGAGGDPDDPRDTDAGAALELLHCFACIHDDVMDDSPRRHGIDTLHVDFARRHHQGAWRGPAERFGAAVAVLVGDLAFVYADRLLSGAGPAAMAVWHELRLEVNLGQYLDLDGTARASTNPELARRICQYKSGKYTVERPLHLGAALARPDPDGATAAALSAFGMPLGEAFQLRDDLLGVFGDPAVTGKPVGEDLREGKPTLLAALAREGATGPDDRLIERRFGCADLSDAEIAALQGAFERTGARSQVDGVIDGLVDEALDAARRLPLDAYARQALADLARFVSGRDH